MHGDDGARLRRDAALTVGERNRVRLRVAITKHDAMPGTGDGFGRGDKRVGRDDDFALRRQRQGFQRDFDGIRAIADADAILGLLIRGKRFFELLDIFAANERRILQDGRDGCINFLFNALILFSQIQKFNHLMILSLRPGVASRQRPIGDNSVR